MREGSKGNLHLTLSRYFKSNPYSYFPRVNAGMCPRLDGVSRMSGSASPTKNQGPTYRVIVGQDMKNRQTQRFYHADK